MDLVRLRLVCRGGFVANGDGTSGVATEALAGDLVGRRPNRVVPGIGCRSWVLRGMLACFMGCGLVGHSAFGAWAGAWVLKPESVWVVDGEGNLELDTALRNSSFTGTFSADRNFELPADASEKPWRLSAWVRTSGVHGSPRHPALRMMLHGRRGLREQLATYTADKDWTYLETQFQPAHGEESVKLVLSSQIQMGVISIRDIRLEPISEDRRGLEALNQVDGSGPWHLEDRRFRLRGQVEPVVDGAPVWADLDFGRLLLAAGVVAPVDPSSVEVVGIRADGSSVSCPVAFNQPIGSLTDDLERNGLVKWRAVDGVADYEIYFNPADSAGAKPKAGEFLGVGELLAYPADSKSPLWAGWPGKAIYPIDADSDGDLDLVLESNDGGWWIARNVGSQNEPLFLPRARFLETDRRPSRNLLNGVFVDWDGDGTEDKLTVKKTPRGNYVQGTTAVLQLESEGRSPIQLRHMDGSPLVFDDATWINVAAGDLTGDGMAELIVGTSDNQLRMLKRDPADPAQVEVSLIPFNTFAGRPFEAPDLVFSPSIVDWDGDGLNDLVTTSWSGECRLFLNKGAGEFDEPTLLQQVGGVVAVSDSATPAVTDWNGDGLDDLLLGDVSGRITWIENVGKAKEPVWAYRGYLTHSNGDPVYLVPGSDVDAVQGRPEQFMGYSSALGFDWDGDGDPDLITNDALGRLSWIENLGTATAPQLADDVRPLQFDGEEVRTPWRNAPAAADWDGDGFPELVVLNDQGQLARLTLSQEKPGTVTHIETLELASGGPAVINAPKGLDGPNLRALGATGRSNLSSGDVNHDGTLDVLIGFSRDVMGGGNLLFCKNVGTNEAPRFEIAPFRTGNGRFVEWTGSEGRDQSHNGAPGLHDWDGDGRVDLLHGVETGRVGFYDSDYLNLEAFPIFHWQEFAEQNEGQTKVLISESSIPSSLPLDVAQPEFPIQWLPLEAKLNQPGAENVQRRVQVTSPALGDTISGSVPIEAEVSGVGVITVDFYLDGKLLGTERTPPYICFGDDAVWDSASVPDGTHELSIRVTYFDGEVLVAKRVLTVSNNP